MKYKEAVFLCIKYIEKNLKQELSAEIIAREIGYSVYHFSRIFKYEMGITLMEYVKESFLVLQKILCLGKEYLIQLLSMDMKLIADCSKIQ